MKLVILRGIPGSGKSTVAASYPGAMIASADSYYMVGGEYVFDPSKIAEAQGHSFRQAIAFVLGLRETIVIDNTNVTVAEIAPYYLLGQAYGYDVEIVTVICDVEKASQRNVHGVDSETVKGMALQLDQETARFMPWWIHRTL